MLFLDLQSASCRKAVRWWDRWLKDKKNGVEKDPLYTAYMQDSAPPKAYYKERAGRWIAEDKWPSKSIKPLKLKLNRGALDKRAQTGGQAHPQLAAEHRHRRRRVLPDLARRRAACRSAHR